MSDKKEEQSIAFVNWFLSHQGVIAAFYIKCARFSVRKVSDPSSQMVATTRRWVLPASKPSICSAWLQCGRKRGRVI